MNKEFLCPDHIRVIVQLLIQFTHSVAADYGVMSMIAKVVVLCIHQNV